MQATTKSFFIKAFKPSTFRPPSGTNLTEADAVYTWLNQMLFTGMLDNLTHIPPDTDIHQFQCTFHEMAIALEYDVHIALGGPKADLHTKAILLQKLMRAPTLQ